MDDFTIIDAVMSMIFLFVEQSSDGIGNASPRYISKRTVEVFKDPKDNNPEQLAQLGNQWE